MSQVPGKAGDGAEGPADTTPFRKAVLERCGAQGPVLDELLAYGANAFAGHPGLSGAALPMPDEPHLEAWTEYERDAREKGAFRALQSRFAQLRFPIQEGISKTPDYRGATLRGVLPWSGTTGLSLVDEKGVTLLLNPTPAGRIPIVLAAERADFVTLVRAFTCRNEPEPIPDSMGACIVTGLNNWDRIARYRASWEAAHAEEPPPGAWDEEFQRLVPRKELYQDRFIILSSGPYSALQAKDAGYPEAEWRRLSVVIRREHECTHYFTYRVLGAMRNNAHDELMADFAGLARALGRYDGELALKFLGLEAHPRYREGGRLESYLGKPRLSEVAFAVLRTLAYRTVLNLEAFLRERPALLGEPQGVARLVLGLAALTLEELASPEMPLRLGARLGLEQRPAPLARRPRSLTVRIPNTDAGLKKLLERFARFAESQPALASACGDMSVALDEIVSNTIKYGYPRKGRREISVRAVLKGGCLEVEMVDDARAFNVLEAPEPRTDQALHERPIGGLGIHIVKRLMDGMEYRRTRGRNHLVLRKKIGGSGPGPA